MPGIEAMLKGKRILAIDDLVESRSAMKKMLIILGASEVDIAMDGNEATDFIKEHDYDIVISDYNLGRGRDGQQILEEARYTNRLHATSTFVMLTGENAMDMVMGALEYEPDDYVTKPFTIDVMRKRLTRILSVKALLEPINHAIDLQAWDKALILCDAFIEKKPQLAKRVERIKGRTLLKMKRYDDAITLYKGIVEERDISWALLGEATCFYHQGKLEEALKVLEYTVQLHPKYVQCYDLIAKIQLKQKKREEAQNTLKRATEISPKQVLRQMELGRIALANKDMDVAEVAYRQSVKLARHSCYRNVGNYINFAKSLQHKINDKNSREVRASSSEALKVLEEVKTTYKENPEHLFDAKIIEATTYTNLGREKDAKAIADKAEIMLSSVNDPTVRQQLSMANTFIETKQHAKAQDLLGVINARKDLSKHDKKGLSDSRDKISEKVVREYTTEINDKAIAYFERGQLAHAIKLFDQATAYSEAGYAVLLNAIQAKVTYMDQGNGTKEMVKEAEELFERLGPIPENDERFKRWTQLQKTQKRLKRSVK